MESSYYLFFHRAANDPKSDGTPECRRVIRIAASATGTGDIRTSEPANETGMAAQAMRHQEKNLEIIERMTLTSMKELQGQNTMMWSRMKQLQDRELETMMVLRKTLLDQADIEQQREKARTEAMLYGKLLEQAELLVPVVLGKFLKAKPGTDEEKREQQDLEDDPPFELTLVLKFIMSLEPDQITEIGSVLNMGQRAALQELQSGGVPKVMIPILVSKVMNGLSAEQYQDIIGYLRNEEQFNNFQAIYRTRKSTLDWQKHRELERAKEETKAEAETPAVEAETTPPEGTLPQ